MFPLAGTVDDSASASTPRDKNGEPYRHQHLQTFSHHTTHDGVNPENHPSLTENDHASIPANLRSKL
jgi:hypothetical protein